MKPDNINQFTPLSAVRILTPEHQRVPVVFASPHSGRLYPADFLAQSCLDPLSLRTSEDAFIDELFAGVVDLGAPLITAQFPRAYVDVNREAMELDPDMFKDPLPAQANTTSSRVKAGIGTIARVVGNNRSIYQSTLSYNEASKRLAACYFPYHQALQRLLDQTLAKFGMALLVDCHSMPSPPQTSAQAEFVIGDCWGKSCAPEISNAAEHAILAMGYSVRRNTPYAGGYTIEHYGHPKSSVHAIQIEISRGLYMDQRSVSCLPVFDVLRKNLLRLAETLCATQGEARAAQ